MDELKELIHLVAGLPNVVLWVLVGFLVYKLAVVGSIYGTIRFVAAQLFAWLSLRKTRTEDVTHTIERLVITGNLHALVGQLSRIVGKGTRIETAYIHAASIDWLRRAIDAMEEQERQPKTIGGYQPRDDISNPAPPPRKP